MIPSIETIPLLQLASGDWLSLQVYKFTGATPGKKVYLQANLHGAELAGNAVIHQLMDWLITLDQNQVMGEIWLVPVCNPLGTNLRSHYFSSGRFNPYDGKDWNRIFWDYEKEAKDLMAFAQSHLDSEPEQIQHHYRQQIQTHFRQLQYSLETASYAPFREQYRYHLQSLCLDADYLIDLHSSASCGIDYLYYFRQREASARWFLLPIGILLEQDQFDGDAFDESFIKPWLALEDCFAQLGRTLQFDIEAWTLELGSAMQLNPESVASGVRGVKNYLMQKGVVKLAELPTFLPNMKFVDRNQVRKYYAPAGGMIQAQVPLGCQVSAGQRLYQILSFNKQGQLPSIRSVEAEESGLVFDVSLNQAVNQGEYVLGILPIPADAA